MASLRSLASPARTGLAPSTLVSTSNASFEAQRAFATSSRALRAPPPASQPGRIAKPQDKNERGRFGLAPLSSPAPPHASKPYNRLTVSIVQGLAKLMGYNRLSSSAIRATSDMYDRCSEVSELQRDFWYRGACAQCTLRDPLLTLATSHSPCRRRTPSLLPNVVPHYTLTRLASSRPL
jgi:cytochrome b pre-mRNA-processing protein 3